MTTRRSASYWRYATSARTDGSTTITTVIARRPRLYSDKYRSLAARYGWATERKFAANVYGGVAGTALAAGRYDDCARYSLRALGNDPRSVRGLARLVVGIGGPRVHELVRSAR